MPLFVTLIIMSFLGTILTADTPYTPTLLLPSSSSTYTVFGPGRGTFQIFFYELS